MSGKTAALRVALLTATLAPALAAGLVHDADAGTTTRDGCSVTPYAPTPIYAPHHPRPVAAQYRVRVTCNPHAFIKIHQEALERDVYYPDRQDDLISKRTGGYAFGHRHGYVTRVFTWRVATRNTEPGAEEMFQKVSFRVSHGHGLGRTWWATSPITSFAN